jgi:hypothetical protein
MNWFTRLKTAMPLPKSRNGSPPIDPHADSLQRTINDFLPQHEADRINAEHGNDIDFIGRGSYGLAYRTQKNKVVKVTTDPSEKQVIDSLQSTSPCIVPIHDARPVQGKNRFGDEKKLWVIESEYIKPIEGQTKYIVSALHAYLKYDSKLPAYEAFAAKFSEPLSPSSKEVYRRYQELLACLAKSGHQWADPSPNNIGIKEDGRFVLFDLGEDY